MGQYVNVSVRLTEEDIGRLDALAVRLGNVATRTSLARQALRLGIARIEAEGFAALETAPSKKSSKK